MRACVEEDKGELQCLEQCFYVVVDSIIHNASSTGYVSQTVKGKRWHGTLCVLDQLLQHLAEGER